ncbi:hypothetical protein PanWU01x14_063370, partial [Parasponia andersonii]
SLWVVKRSTLSPSLTLLLSLSLSLSAPADFESFLPNPPTTSQVLHFSFSFFSLKRNIILKFASNASQAIDDATALSYWESVA